MQRFYSDNLIPDCGKIDFYELSLNGKRLDHAFFIQLNILAKVFAESFLCKTILLTSSK